MTLLPKSLLAFEHISVPLSSLLATEADIVCLDCRSNMLNSQ